MAHRTEAVLRPDPARVVARLFLPGEEGWATHSRVRQVVERVMVVEDDKVDALVTQLLSGFAQRHHDFEDMLTRHASVVASHLPDGAGLSAARTLLLGATFTCEYAVEGAALCNPSTVRHLDQSNLAPGQVRVAVSVRGIGEGHVSSIGFATAVIGPGRRWSFEPRPPRATAGKVSPAQWDRDHLKSALADICEPDEVAVAVLGALPDRFGMADFERTVADAHPDLLSRTGTSVSLNTVRDLISSDYVVEFARDTDLTERVLMPWAVEESQGMEDARFTRFVGEDGAVDYRATYTAYDGKKVAPRLLLSRDLRTFGVHRLIGSAARNKGMALFPRLVQGVYLALCRTDGESTSIAASADGFDWKVEQVIHSPSRTWESVQVGNCGPPIETERGWLVITHAVGAMRTYTIGAMLLDLSDPRIVLGMLDQPLLTPTTDEQNGYVPNVVYSCGGFVHDDVLWLPYGIGDARIGVAHFAVSDVLDAMSAR